MRLLPRSLFARMVLILLGGLVAAQLLSFAIHWQERGEFIMRATGMRSAQRIADIVQAARFDCSGRARQNRERAQLAAAAHLARRAAACARRG